MRVFSRASTLKVSELEVEGVDFYKEYYLIFSKNRSRENLNGYGRK